MSDSFGSPTPQFGTAEYIGKTGNDHCQFCHVPIAGTYYRANDAMACAACTEKVRGALAKDNHTAYMRALVYGFGAAIVGLILYATFAITTGLIIGYASLAVGWMVGKAMMQGSGGVGGRRYQVTAALLTYAAVSMASIPVWIHYANEHRQQYAQQRPTQQPSQQQQSEDSHQLSTPADASEQTAQSRPRMSRPEAFLRLGLMGIASPLVEVWEGGPSFGWLIGLVILVIGIKIAWKMTAGRALEVFGPFET